VSEISSIINPKPATLILSSDETLLLWQLLNAQGVSVPPARAHIAASTYEKLKNVAEMFGHVKT
jgi:hypothetical protein